MAEEAVASGVMHEATGADAAGAWTQASTSAVETATGRNGGTDGHLANFGLRPCAQPD